MTQNNENGSNGGAGEWLKRRDRWMRELLASSNVSRNGKLAGIYIALRMSAKRPFTYPAMESMAIDLGISVRQVVRAVTELRDEHFIVTERPHGRVNVYKLAM